MRYKILMILSTLLIVLTGCSNKAPTPPKVVVKYKTVKTDIPAELLRCAKAPSADILKGVTFLKGADKAKRYTKKLVLTNYKNCQKIKAIKKLVTEDKK